MVKQKKIAVAMGDQIDIKEKPVLSPLTMDDMQSPFWVLSALLLIGVISFIIEFLCGTL